MYITNYSKTLNVIGDSSFDISEHHLKYVICRMPVSILAAFEKRLYEFKILIYFAYLEKYGMTAF